MRNQIITGVVANNRSNIVQSGATNSILHRLIARGPVTAVTDHVAGLAARVRLAAAAARHARVDQIDRSP